MPSRSTKKAVDPAKTEGTPMKVQSSPLKNAAHKFLTAVGLFDSIKEESERMTKAGELKVPTLYVTFTNDDDAYRAALAFLQEGDQYGGTGEELLMIGFPKNEPGDDLICMFQFIPRDSEGLPLSDKIPTKAVEALIGEVDGAIPYNVAEIPKGKDQPAGLAVFFDDELDAARVAWQFLSTDVTDNEKTNPLDCVGDKDEPLALAFFSVATQ